MPRRLLVPLLVSVTALLVAPASPVAATTRADPSKREITLTIPVDVIGAEGLTGPDKKTPLIEYWTQIVNDTWGAAFKKLPYRGCSIFSLKIDLQARGRDERLRDGRHKLYVTAARTGGGWDGVGWQGVPETSRNPKTGDGTRSLETARSGTIPANAPPTIVAHEFGHLFGLGDDRENGEPKNEREGTLMVGGVPGVDVNVVQRIDQNLIDRIGKIVEKHLENKNEKPLEPCETYKGTIKSSTSVIMSPSGVTIECNGEENGTVTLAVFDRDVFGTIEASGSRTCTGPASSITDQTAGTIHLVGTREDGTIRLRYDGDVEAPTGYFISPPCIAKPVEIRVARGTGSVEIDAGDVIAPWALTCSIEIEREREDEPVG